MRIRNQAVGLAASLAMSLLAVVPAFAKHAREVNLVQAVTINGKQLSPGRYQVSWDTQSPQGTVTFKQKKAVVVAAPFKLEERPQKYEYNSVVYTVNSNGASTVLEIRFAGSNQVLTFDTSSPSANLISPGKTLVEAGEAIKASSAATAPGLSRTSIAL